MWYALIKRGTGGWKPSHDVVKPSISHELSVLRHIRYLVRRRTARAPDKCRCRVFFNLRPVHERLLRSARPHNTRARGEEAERDDETRALLKLKPDVVIYHGLRQEELSDFLDGKKAPPKGMKIQILEVGYCNDWNWEKKIEEKGTVNKSLVSRMRRCGWKN